MASGTRFSTVQFSWRSHMTDSDLSFAKQLSSRVTRMPSAARPRIYNLRRKLYAAPVAEDGNPTYIVNAQRKHSRSGPPGIHAILAT